MTPEIRIRPGDMGNILERNHVLASWLRSMTGKPAADGSGERSKDAFWVQAVGRENFFRGHEKLIKDRLIPSSQILVASLPEEPDAIVGWVCFQSGVPHRLFVEPKWMLHYLFVKPKWRLLGIGKALVQAACAAMGQSERLVYTHRSPMASSLPIPASWRFDPYPALEVSCAK